MGRLTEAKVRTTRPTDRDQWLNDGDGLYLCIRKGGGKGGIIRRKQAGKTQIITLDSYPPLTLKEARQRASEYLLKTHVSNATVAELAGTHLARGRQRRVACGVVIGLDFRTISRLG